MKKAIVVGFGVLFAVIGVVAATYTTCTPGTITIETARISGERARAIGVSGRELGLTCINNSEDCAELIARAKKNSRLKAALLKAKAADVGIQPRSMLWFSVGHINEGYVVVNTRYSDKGIIAFLMK